MCKIYHTQCLGIVTLIKNLNCPQRLYIVIRPLSCMYAVVQEAFVYLCFNYKLGEIPRDTLLPESCDKTVASLRGGNLLSASHSNLLTIHASLSLPNVFFYFFPPREWKLVNY